jgi:hypothetical protein
MVAKGCPKVCVLAQDDLDIGNYRETVFLVYQTVCSSPEDNIGNELGLLVDTVVLSDRDSNGIMVFVKIRSHVLICEDDFNTHNCVLGVLGPLKKQIHINVLDSLKFGLACLDLSLIFFVFRNLLADRGSLCRLRVRLLSCCSGCFRIWLGSRRWLLSCGWLFVVLLFFLR